ncbi:MAG: hypothetical protein V3U11_12290 [Planctomycetota bacterium]
MPDAVPIAVLGGSSAFLPTLAAALADRANQLPPLEIRLVGRDPRRTAIVARFCTLHAEGRGVRHQYRPVPDVETAAEGVPLVVNQVRIGGFAGRSRDEQLALEFGCPGDETIGPGGLASAWRSLPPILHLARRIERVAPEAWLVQISNPMPMLLAGLLQETGLRTFGLCELPTRTLEQALGLIGRPPAAVESHYVGVNHQGWFVQVDAGGIDLLPEIFDRVEELDNGGPFFRVDAIVMRTRGALPLPYLRLYEHREREIAQMRARRQDRGEELADLAARLYALYATTDDPALPAALSARNMPWNPMTLVPAIIALLGGPPARAYVSEPNGGHLPFLPHQAIVEKLATVGRSGPQAPPPCTLPLARTHPHIVELLSQICEFERLGATAALRRDPDMVLAALRTHPFGISAATATALLPGLLSAEHATTVARSVP